MADADTEPKRPNCRACGGRLLVLVRLKASEARTPLAYLRCERCAHVLVVDE